MSKELENKKLIQVANKALLSKLEEGNFNAIKFTLENLDGQFSIDVKTILNGVYKNIMEFIKEYPSIHNDDKVKLAHAIKNIIDECS